MRIEDLVEDYQVLEYDRVIEKYKKKIELLNENLSNQNKAIDNYIAKMQKNPENAQSYIAKAQLITDSIPFMENNIRKYEYLIKRAVKLKSIAQDVINNRKK